MLTLLKGTLIYNFLPDQSVIVLVLEKSDTFFFFGWFHTQTLLALNSKMWTFFSVPEIEPRVLHLLGKCIAWTAPNPSFLLLTFAYYNRCCIYSKVLGLSVMQGYFLVCGDFIIYIGALWNFWRNGFKTDWECTSLLCTWIRSELVFWATLGCVLFMVCLFLVCLCLALWNLQWVWVQHAKAWELFLPSGAAFYIRFLLERFTVFYTFCLALKQT